MIDPQNPVQYQGAYRVQRVGFRAEIYYSQTLETQQLPVTFDFLFSGHVSSHSTHNY